MTELEQLRADNALLRFHLEELSLYVAHNGDDWVQIKAKQALSHTPSDSYEELKKLNKEINSLYIKVSELEQKLAGERWYKARIDELEKVIKQMKEALEEIRRPGFKSAGSCWTIANKALNVYEGTNNV